MRTHYEKLVEEMGIDAANEYMRSIRSKVKNPGLASIPKKQRGKIFKKGWATRKRNEKTNTIDSKDIS